LFEEEKKEEVDRGRMPEEELERDRVRQKNV